MPENNPFASLTLSGHYSISSSMARSNVWRMKNLMLCPHRGTSTLLTRQTHSTFTTCRSQMTVAVALPGWIDLQWNQHPLSEEVMLIISSLQGSFKSCFCNVGYKPCCYNNLQLQQVLKKILYKPVIKSIKPAELKKKIAPVATCLISTATEVFLCSVMVACQYLSLVIYT